MRLLEVNNDNFESFKYDIRKYITLLTLDERERKDSVEEYVTEKIEAIPSYIQNGSAFIIIGVEDGIVVLFLWAYRKSELTMHLTQFVVDKNYRRKGYAKKALEMLIEKMRQEKMEYLNLNAVYDNLAALNLYKSFGFKIEKVFMEKKIT